MTQIRAKSLINMVRSEGLEPPTPWFEAKYSIQLSYERIFGTRFLEVETSLFVETHLNLVRFINLSLNGGPYRI
jgi:hypothetical protein